MIRMAICDDSPQAIEKLEKLMDTINQKSIEYDTFYHSEELIQYQQRNNIKYNVYILDIEMEEMDGISLAKKLREENMNAIIIFLTAYKDYVFNSFDVLAFDYIVKPITAKKLEKILEKIYSYLNKSKKLFMFSYRKNQYSIECQEIKYIEKRGRQALIHTNDEIYKANLTMEQLWEQLDDEIFVLIHPSVIINLFHVKEIVRGELLLKQGDTLYISRNYRQLLKTKHLKFVKENI